MCQALMEIMKPKIDEIVNTAVLQERRKTEERVEREIAERVEKATVERIIKATVKNLRRFNASNADIKTSLVEDFGLSEQEALSYLQ